MANYTITTTPAQDTLLAWIVQQFNLDQGTALTTAQFVAAQFVALLIPFDARFQKASGESVKTAYATADAATQQQVKTLLGITTVKP